jgi:hypothetical protein
MSVTLFVVDLQVIFMEFLECLKMKAENGFYYEVTSEQVTEHRKRSIKEILMWLHNTNVFLKKIQTDKERERMKLFKKNKKI